MLEESEIRRLVRLCQRADERAREQTGARPAEQTGEQTGAQPAEPAGEAASENEGPDPASDAWAALHTHFHPRIRAFCRRTLSGDAADDLAGDIMLKTRFRLGTFDASRPFAPWLFRIAANRCWDEARRARRSEPLDDETAAQVPSDQPDPLDRLLVAESRERVREALARLPLRQRFALALRYCAGAGYQEIADALGVTRTNVGVLLLRGRRRLRAELGEGS